LAIACGFGYARISAYIPTGITNLLGYLKLY
jgi:hypothetical protein